MQRFLGEYWWFITGGVVMLVFLASRFRMRSKAPGTAGSGQPVKDDERQWLRRADWRAGVVRSTVAERTDLTHVIAVLIVMHCAGSFFSRSWRIAMIGAVVIAIVTVIWRHLLKMRRQRFGVSEFRFDQVPFMPGFKVRGTVIVPHDLSRGLTNVELTCEVSAEDSVKWSSTHELMSHQLRHENGKTQIPVEFDLPGDLPETRGFWRGFGSSVAWRLRVKHAMPELNYVASFDLPVFDWGPVEDTMRVRASKRRLERELSVFDAPDDRSTP